MQNQPKFGGLLIENYSNRSYGYPHGKSKQWKRGSYVDPGPWAAARSSATDDTGNVEDICPTWPVLLLK